MKFIKYFSKDVIAIIVGTFLLFLISVEFDAFERLVDFVTQYEEYELDELVMLLLFSSLAFILIIVRNVKLLKVEIALRNLSESKLNQMAFYDGLTGLPNRSLCNDRLNQAISQAKRNNRVGAAFFIDLDNFKYINDSYGHGVGDELLKQFSKRISNQLRMNDTLSRYSGDEFVIIIDSSVVPSGIAVVAQKLMTSLKEPFYLQGDKVFVNMSIGISVYPSDASTADELLKCADIAMYHAKSEGKSTYCFYSYELEQETRYKLKLSNKLHDALDNNEFSLQYQPILDVKSQKIIGAEALLRWRNDELGAVPPDVFIPIAEEIGLMDDIGNWVIEQACISNEQWHLQGYKDLIISVNMSAKQLSNGCFVDNIKKALKLAQLSPEYLEMELTETALLKDIDVAINQIALMKELGISVALDDFGTGYSSMSYLVKLKINRLKIDKSFIQNIPCSADDVITTKAIVALAKNLNLKVTAEGIENKEQLDFFKETACDSMQGYLLSYPLSKKDFEIYLKAVSS